jgi:hypothetical protein
VLQQFFTACVSPLPDPRYIPDFDDRVRFMTGVKMEDIPMPAGLIWSGPCLFARITLGPIDGSLQMLQNRQAAAGTRMIDVALLFPESLFDWETCRDARQKRHRHQCARKP